MAINNPGSNVEARDRLVTALRSGRLFSLTGAGLSVWAGYQTWQGFLNRLSDTVARKEGDFVSVQQINELITNPLWRARKLVGYLGEGFQDFFRAEFGPRSIRPDNVMFRFAALPFRHHITLNFDPSIETTLQAMQRTFGVSSSARAGDLIKFLRRMDDNQYVQQVVHLHGTHGDDVDKIVLTEDGYKALYADNPMRKNFLWTLFATRRLVFTGFGYTDNDFLSVLQECCRHTRLPADNLTHFAIIGLRDDANDDQKRYELADSYHTDAVFYNVNRDADGHPDHREFGELITGVANELCTVEPPVATTMVAQATEPADADDLLTAIEMTSRLRRHLGRGLIND